jgi:hypothetical protein
VGFALFKGLSGYRNIQIKLATLEALFLIGMSTRNFETIQDRYSKKCT